MNKRVIILGSLMVLVLSGCASEQYVRRQTDPLAERLSKIEAQMQNLGDAKDTATKALETANKALSATNRLSADIKRADQDAVKAESAEKKAEKAAKDAENAARKSEKLFKLEQKK